METDPLVQQQNIAQPLSTTPSLNHSSNRSKAALILLVFIILVIVSVGVYILGKRDAQPISQSNVTNRPSQLTPTVLPSPATSTETNSTQNVITLTPTTDPKTQWNTYTIANFGLQFSLPPSIYTGQGDFKEAIGKGQAGTEVCIYFAKAEVASNNNKTNGICWTNDNDLFVMGADSMDFEAGRSGTFMDTLGFSQKGTTFYENLNLNRKSDLTAYNPQRVNNENGVNIIKIKGTVSDSRSPYCIGETLCNGWLGALVDTKKADYPGLGIQIRLSNDVTESLFNQILSNFKFTN